MAAKVDKMACEIPIEGEEDVNKTLMKNGGRHKNGPDRRPKGWRACQWFKRKNIIIAVLSCCLLGSVIGNIIQAATRPSPPRKNEGIASEDIVDGCIRGWSRHGDQCYISDNAEHSWDFCNSFCSASDASLVTLNSEEERALLKSKEGEYWIDLQREKGNQWKWKNSTSVTEFEVKGTGFCAYTSGDTVSSTTCDNIRRCICRKQVSGAKQ
ncbi:natural killer cells antigen CD94-like [Paroedura picta]|uniref:natural killer cells antigen CD94-like n=1 Tax=Paroedura picta TaxID=143630 RepID=UPI00405614C0